MERNIKLDNEVNNFNLEFLVEDPTHGQVGEKAVMAIVKVTIQKITKEAVISSGSIRIEGTPEDFIVQGYLINYCSSVSICVFIKVLIFSDENGSSKWDKLKSLLMKQLNATYVDIFTVLRSGERITDVR